MINRLSSFQDPRPHRLLAALACLPLFGISDAAFPAEAADEIRIALQGDIKGTNPGVLRDGNTDTVIHHIVESLVAYQEDLAVAPHLASRIDVSEDLTRYTFHLRTDVTFHTGAPMTSREIVWSWQRMLDPATQWRCRHWFDGSGSQGVAIRSITASDPRTVVFELDSPSSVFLDRMANVQCVTAILHPDSVAKDGSWRKPVATGPYQVGEWQRGRYILLERFDGYTPRAEPRNGYAGARKALVPRIRFIVIGDAAAGVAGILTGDLDILPLLPLHLAQEFRRRDDVRVQGKGQLSWSILLMQMDDPLLRDSRIRRAIAHAIKLDEVATISTFGNAVANPSAVPTQSSYRTAVHDRWWGYDPAAAKALLAAAKYANEEIRIQTNRKIPFMFENAVAVQAMLTAVGMNVQLDVTDWATQLSNFYSGKFQLSSFGYSARTHPILNYAAFLGDPDVMTNAQWANPDALILLERAEATANHSEQVRFLEQVHLLMREDLPLMGLYNEYAVDVSRASISGYEPWVLGRPRLWGVSKQADSPVFGGTGRR